MGTIHGRCAISHASATCAGAAFFRSVGIERLVRDLHGAQFHPMQEKRQHVFTGRVALGLEPIAEGVETEQQARLLREMGCAFAQGFVFSRPVPPREIDELLRNSAGR